MIGGAALLAVGGVVAVAPSAHASVPFAVESLDGSGNNVNHPSWGQANLAYARVGPARYTDGIGQPFGGPNPRQISNRVVNDQAQNVFSERRVSNWGWAWGQFLDHTFGHRIETGAGADAFNITFQPGDPLEDFTSTAGVIGVNRSPNTPGTGTSTANPRQETNQIPSYLSANVVYGATNARLDWLRSGSLDGDPTDNSAALMLPGGYLPTRADRGDPAGAPAMDVDGRLAAHPNDTAVAGDARANENIALTATHTLFAREHNRIVSLLPATLSDEDKFQIARRVVIAEEQYVTYQEWLPAMGVSLPRYTGYNPNVNATLTNEFATVGYRAHTQIHGDGLEIETDADRYSAADLADFEAQGLEVTADGDEVAINVPLGVMLFNPTLLRGLQEGPVIQALGAEMQYKNDEEIDNQLRSTLFQVPTSTDADCLNGPTMPECFSVVNDLGAIDIQRNRDHGIGTINQIRQAYGLPAYTSFTQLTGESTEAFPTNDPLLTGTIIDDPDILDVTRLTNIDGQTIDLNGDQDVVAETGVNLTRRTTLAARLKAVYGTVDKVDAFVGVFAEKHLPGVEMGPTQLAIWQKQFQALRDGDRFYFANDQGLSFIRTTFGIDYRHTLAQIIELNTDLTAADLNPSGNVFLTPDAAFPAAACQITYSVSDVTGTTFRGNLSIKNTGNQTIFGWTAAFELAQGQVLQQPVAGAVFTQSGSNALNKTASSLFGNRVIPPGATVNGVSFTASWDGFVNQKPGNFTLNARRCTVP